MGTTFIPKTTTQVIPEIALNERPIGPTTVYTCPVGKKAIATFVAICDAVGAASSTFLRDPTDTFNYATWVASGGTFDPSFLSSLGVGTAILVKFEIEAGQTISVDQNTGTNASFRLNGTILELAA